MPSKIGVGSSVGDSYGDLPDFNDRKSPDAAWTEADNLWLKEHPIHVTAVPPRPGGLKHHEENEIHEKKGVVFTPESVKIREYEILEGSSFSRTPSTKMRELAEKEKETKEAIGIFFLEASKSKETAIGKLLSSLRVEAQSNPQEFFANLFQILASALRDETLDLF